LSLAFPIGKVAYACCSRETKNLVYNNHKIAQE
jgi:hypothetical protein